jgi:NAD(P)-dependent dehydrogenase (short-subunit alcohol dehydrogenase family)
MITRMPPDQQRVSLVTGSSRGLGSAIARRLASDGLAVAVNGLHGDAQALEVAAIRERVRAISCVRRARSAAAACTHGAWARRFSPTAWSQQASALISALTQ